MRPFEYLTPVDLDEALGVLSEHPAETAPIAGGQSLLLDLKSRQRTPKRLISLAGIDELSGACLDETGLRIGPTTTYRALGDGLAFGSAAATASVADFLSRVASNIADRAVRSMATVGGSVCQAEPAFDMPVALSAVGACFEIAGSDCARRSVPAEEFFIGIKQTALGEAELLSAIVVPNPGERWLWGYAKQGMRAHDAALTSVGVALGCDDQGLVRQSRLVVGGMVRCPQRARLAEAWLVGTPTTEIDALEFGERIAAEVTPEVGGTRFGPGYRHRLVPVLARRALSGARHAA